MKKTLSLFLCIVIIGNLFSFSVHGNESETVEHVLITYFPDGSYCIETITECRSLPGRAVKNGTKTRVYYSSSDIRLFSTSVYGEFTYDGTTATATYAQLGYQIYSSAWSYNSGIAFCSGASATASCTFDAAYGFRRTLSVTLTCSPTGVLT